jgi:hypothetical protein
MKVGLLDRVYCFGFISWRMVIKQIHNIEVCSTNNSRKAIYPKEFELKQLFGVSQ